MKILYCDATGTRGVAEKFTECVNRYYPEHSARALIGRSFFDREAAKLKSPCHPIGDREKRDFLLTEWADVIHLIHQTSLREMGRADLLGKKPVVYHRFTLLDKGDWYRHLWKEEDFRHLRLVLVAEGWQRYPLWKDRKYTMLPAPFPIEDPLYLPRPIRQRRRLVSLCAMNRKEGPPAPKGIDLTLSKLRGLTVDYRYRRPFGDVMEAKSRAWVGIDEVVTPILHFAPFEYLALGVPCVTWWDEMTERTLKDATGATGPLPFLNATIDTVRRVCERALAVPPEEMEAESLRLRAWISTYMHPRKVIDQYLSLYS